MSAQKPFAPGNAAELHAFSLLARSDRPSVVAVFKHGYRPAFRPIETGGLNWAGALQELRKPPPVVLTRFTFLVDLGTRQITRTWSGADEKDARELCFAGLSWTEQERFKSMTLVTSSQVQEGGEQ